MKNSYNALWYMFARYRRIYLFVFILSLAVAFLESVNIAALLPFLNIFIGGAAHGAQEGYILTVISKVIDLIPFSDKLLSACILLISVTTLKTAVSILNEFLIAYASGKVIYGTKRDIIEKYTRAPFHYFLDQKQGTLMYYVLTATNRVSKLLYTVSEVSVEFFKMIAIIAFLFTVNLRISLLLMLFSLVFGAIIGILSKKVSYNLGKQQLEASAEQGNLLNEFITGIKHIRVYGAMDRWVKFFAAQSRRYTNLFVKEVVWRAVPTNIMEMALIVFLVGATLIIKTYSSADMASYVPLVGIFGASILALLPSLRSIGKNRMAIVGMLPDAEVVQKLLQQDHERGEGENRIFRGFSDSIRFEETVFAYDKRKPVLDDMDIAFHKNKVNAIIGASGSGKTTMINLLLGLFKVDSGRILVDDIDIREYRQDTWLNKVALVSQEPFIFHSTIIDNISFGKQYSVEEVKKAAMIANAHSFIEEMPQGYDTIVGERGMKLSGGQQQRIAIARAVLRQPEILILDEATSALDSVSEKAIQDAINNISKLCTLIIIAHRLFTVKSADKISVIKNGKVVEEGSHDNLLARNGYYRELYEHQAI